MLSHHATTRQQRYQHLVNDAVLERKEKNREGKSPREQPRQMHVLRKHTQKNKQEKHIQTFTDSSEHCHTRTSAHTLLHV